MACKYQLPLVVVIVYFTTAAYGRGVTCSTNKTHNLSRNGKYHYCRDWNREGWKKIEEVDMIKDMILNGSVVYMEPEGVGVLFFIPREDLITLEAEKNKNIKQEIENALWRQILKYNNYYLTTYVPVLKTTTTQEVPTTEQVDTNKEEKTAASQGVSLPLVLAILLAVIAFVGIGSYMYCKTSKQAATSVKGNKTSDKKNSAGPKTTDVSESEQNNTATRSEYSEDSNFKSTDGSSS